MVTFDAGTLPSGVYFYRIAAQSDGPAFTDVKKFLLTFPSKLPILCAES
jgi:hypothetical protein